MNGLLCVTAIAAFLVAPNLAIDCNNNRCLTRGVTHIMCIYKNPHPAAACGQIETIEFTAGEKIEIVDKHNELRQFVAAGKEKRGNPGPQPAALYMKTMAWDDELAEIAQRWVNQCDWGHNECRDVDQFAVGQNSALVWSRGKLNTTPADVLMTWYDEVKNMNLQQVKNLMSVSDVGQYTQMMWANTEKIGCGKIYYRSDGLNRYYMVCNYGPSGNYIGEPVYVPTS